MSLITVEENPYNAETPLQALSQTITSTEFFFVRSHFDIPKLDPSAYRLTLDGAVRSPVGFSLADIQSLPVREITVTLECAGNGRVALDPPVPGVRWAFGAASTARFRGTPLRHLLDRAGMLDTAIEALFVGADRGEVEPGRTVAFERSLPVTVAQEDDSILAWEMNGRPLDAPHGAPLRLVVPRWYAVASVKWLTRIQILTHTFQGHFQTEKYVYDRERGTPDGTPVTRMRVRALIAHPAEGDLLPRSPMEISGMAWAGGSSIEKVELSVDGGITWREARLGASPSEHAWTHWTFPWSPSSPGAYLLVARATDASGNLQPVTPSWNAQGYGNNVAHRVRVRVE